MTRISLPVLPAADAAPCPVPGLRAGQQAKIALAEHRLALTECRLRHGRVVGFYGEVKRRFEGGSK